MGFQFGIALVFVVVACLFLAVTLLVGRLVRPRPSGEGTVKGMVYECGEAPMGATWFNFNPRFFLIGLIFLVFDVEVAFTFPVAAAYQRFVALGEGGLAFAEIGAFVAVLALALAYAWRRGDLEWVRELKSTESPAEPQRPIVVPVPER